MSERPEESKWSPIKAQWDDPEQCKTCVFRDRATSIVDGKVYHDGTSKCYCFMYNPDKWPSYKPRAVMENLEPCEDYYKDDENFEPFDGFEIYDSFGGETLILNT